MSHTRKHLLVSLVVLVISVVLVFFAAAVVAGPAAAQSAGAVTTYHYDPQRTGWNQLETTLTQTNVASGTFGILATVSLLDQVDAQPLFVPNQNIVINGVTSTHDVVYVADDSNNIYVIDVSNDATQYQILLQRNLGAPVNVEMVEGCGSPNQGIMGTPTIDLDSSTLFVINYLNHSPPIFQIHALNLTNLADRAGSPKTVTASHTATNGSTLTFNATWLRQRPGLLELNNNIYAGFGSLCDSSANVSQSRGWLLGWSLGLAPLSGNELTDRLTTDPGVAPPVFLSSIWMAGYGLAAVNGDVYFATGNSDCNYFDSPEQCPSKTTYNGTSHIQESVVSFQQNLTTMGSIFNAGNSLALDANDNDLGSGGVLIFATNNTSYPNLAVAGGKGAILYLLNPANLSAALDSHNDYTAFGTWGGPSFFQGSDGIYRIVTGHGFANSDGSYNPNTGSLETWQVQFSPGPHLVHEATATIGSGQDPGFLTSVSSNGTTAGTAIIWAVGRPFDPTTTYVNLYAFADSNGTLTQLYTSPAGSWPNTNGDANIVPVVAKGKVYVAAYQSLTIFGLTSDPTPNTTLSGSPNIKLPVTSNITLPAIPVLPLNGPHEISGTLLTVSGSTLTVQTRTGKSATIDDSQAIIGAPLFIGSPMTAVGSSYTGSGALLATVIPKAKRGSALWPPDR
jgi:hypothetical protein